MNLNVFKNINYFPQFTTIIHFVDNFYHFNTFTGRFFEIETLTILIADL